MRSVYEVWRFPIDRWKLMCNARLSHLALPMAARQANCSHLSDVGFFRDFIFAHSQPTGNNRTFALVASVSREVEKLFFHDVINETVQSLMIGHGFKRVRSKLTINF